MVAQLPLSFDSVTHVESRSDRGPCYFAKNVSTKTFLLSKNARRQLSFLSHSCFDGDVLGFAYRITSIVYRLWWALFVPPLTMLFGRFTRKSAACIAILDVTLLMSLNVSLISCRSY